MPKQSNNYDLVKSKKAIMASKNMFLMQQMCILNSRFFVFPTMFRFIYGSRSLKYSKSEEECVVGKCNEYQSSLVYDFLAGD